MALPHSSLLHTGIYSLPQAARLLGSDARAVRRWMTGHRWKTREGTRRTTPPLWKTQFETAGFEQPAIGFRDLMELRFVRAFVDAGVSLHVVKATIDAARERWRADYPLTSRRFRTDGNTIYEDAMDEFGHETLTDVRRKQLVFTHIIRPSLYAGIHYEGDVATRWQPPEFKGIALDPERRFGAPIVMDTGIPTDVLYDAYVAEKRDRKATALAFEITVRHVDAAVRFEECLRA